MIDSTIEKALNDQIEMEALSSHFYLAMASWAENQGLNGTAEFLYRHSDEERMHMLKLVRFVNERGGKSVVPALDAPQSDFSDLPAIFSTLLEHETKVTASINGVVDLCLQRKDYTTHNFMQWYVAEQIEEEALARNILDKLALIGQDKGGLYLFDRDLEQLQPEA
ncbi:MAG: ferritin [Flavobacteriales bacterium]|nr:ferritin [Flavobacteriales bacterium]